MPLPEQHQLKALYENAPPLMGSDRPWLRVYPSSEEPAFVIRQTEYYDQFTPDDHQRHLAVIAENGAAVPEMKVQLDGRIGYVATAWITRHTSSNSATYAAWHRGVESLEAYEKWVSDTGQPVMLNDLFNITNSPFIYGTSPEDPTPKPWLVDVEPRIYPADKHIMGTAGSLHATIDFFQQLSQR